MTKRRQVATAIMDDGSTIYAVCLDTDDDKWVEVSRIPETETEWEAIASWFKPTFDNNRRTIPMTMTRRWLQMATQERVTFEDA